MSLTLASIEARIKEYETAIAQLIANHATMTGALQELKNLLTIATPVADALSPATGAVLHEVGAVVDAVDNAVVSVDSMGTTGAEETAS